jgi:hypothetical protein
MTGRINVVFKFWNQVNLCGILKLNNLIFGKDADYLAQQFPVFANVFEVKVKKQSNQSFLKCDCLHYERCGIPCTHIIKITNEIDETMITIQHPKVYLVNFGLPDLQLSDQLMKAVSM